MLSTMSMNLGSTMDGGNRDQPFAAARNLDVCPSRKISSCLKSARGPAEGMSKKTKSVTFPLNVLFLDAVKDHRTSDVAEIINLLVPQSFSERTLKLSAEQSTTLHQTLSTQIKLCLDLFNIDVKSKGGYTALMLCARGGQFHAFRLLVLGGANLRHTTRGGWNVFHVLAATGSLDMIRWLLANCSLSNRDKLEILSGVMQDCVSFLRRPQFVDMHAFLKASVEYTFRVENARLTRATAASGHAGSWVCWSWRWSVSKNLHQSDVSLSSHPVQITSLSPSDH